MRVYDTVAIPEDGNVAAAIFAHDCTGYSGNTYSGCALAYSDLNAKAPTLVLETAGAVPTPSGLCP